MTTKKNKNILDFGKFVSERYESESESESYVDNMDQDEFDSRMEQISRYENDNIDEEEEDINEFEFDVDVLTPDDIYSNTQRERERETSIPVKDPVTTPGIKPVRPSSPSPIRRTRPSVEPEPKAIKKATIEDLVKKVMYLNDEK